ncbi:rhodanese-like domain-containing protein [Hydrogenimonas thermophila]|uniref:Rhodanese-related sulfurtransferase n=1 Tax=Hydrogenimonas thermophila TaxID=223786 RepID=A0A1I5L904_9BACT|nr:rhodanese-like domain-containing protein [Hydrogenimonas thermophila]SFO93336.1 Rhodanese-related sulfurtransferase [Hydrogenimonas thermophila]
MKKLITFILFLPYFLFAQVKDIDINTFENMKQNGVPVIDIRTQQEWKETGIIDNSKTIEFFHPDGSYNVEQFLDRLKKLGIDRDKPFVLVCRSSNRTKLLGNFLSNKLGYKEVYHLKGGIINWKAHGKPLKPYHK